MELSSKISSKLHKHRRIAGYLALIMINIGIFSWTSPIESAAWVVFGGFIVGSLDLLVATQLFVGFLCIIVPKIRYVRRRLTIALVSFGVVALALASLGQLTPRDLIVVVIIWLLGYMYSLRFAMHAGSVRSSGP